LFPIKGFVPLIYAHTYILLLKSLNAILSISESLVKLIIYGLIYFIYLGGGRGDGGGGMYTGCCCGLGYGSDELFPIK